MAVRVRFKVRLINLSDFVDLRFRLECYLFFVISDSGRFISFQVDLGEFDFEGWLKMSSDLWIGAN